MSKLGLWILWTFLIVEMTIHYQTRFIPGTLHSWVLLVGCLVTVPDLVHKYGTHPSRLPTDYRIVAALGIVLVIGYFFNRFVADWLTFQAYVLSYASYLFVREQGAKLSLRTFYVVNAWFLITNSVLMLVQFRTGHLYPAQLLAAGHPPLLLPSGFADGPTKNGIIHGAALAVVFARVAILDVPLASVEGGAMLLGAFTLLLTTSRGGVVAALVTILGGAAVLLIAKRSVTSPLRRRVPTIALATLVLLTVIGGGWSAERVQRPSSEQTAAGAAGDPQAPSSAPAVNAEQYTSRVIAFKFISKARPSTMLSDDSIATRFATMYTACYILIRNPLHAVIGMGVGTFTTLFARFGPSLPHRGNIDFGGVSAHDSYLEFLVETGAISFLLLWALIFQVVRVLLRRPDWYDGLPLAGMVSVAMGAMVFHDVLRGRIFWVPLGLLAAFAYSRPIKDVGVPAHQETF